MMRTYCIFFLLWLSSLVALGQNREIGLLRSIHVDRNQNLDRPLIFFSESSRPMSLFFPVGLGAVAAITRDRELGVKAFSMGGGVVISAMVTVGFKYTVQRRRPYEVYSDIVPYELSLTSSMPSGHTSEAFSFATGLSLAFPKWYVIVPAYLYSGTVAYSRLHLGQHYPSDVIMGALIGAGSAYLSHQISKKFLTPKPKLVVE